MATVTSFEELEHPTKSELRQFAELFAPLFNASSDEARRQAVAALSRSAHVPSAVAFFIASQPIAVSAPFLIHSPCLDDETLVTIARTQGGEHARTIVQRENLSTTVVDALVGLRHARSVAKSVTKPAAKHAAATPALSEAAPELAEAAESEGRHLREEALRTQIKQLAAHLSRPSSDRLGLRTITTVQEALLVRFARGREADSFATTLADTLSASRWLAERIMLDISGHQLATTLKGLGAGLEESLFILERFYSHLREIIGDVCRSQILWDTLDAEECAARIEAWRRADQYTYATPVQKPDAAEPVVRTSASQRPKLRAVR
ncbi:DUF2336 domain-containing protein [Rhizobium oryzicola]